MDKPHLTMTNLGITATSMSKSNLEYKKSFTKLK